MSLTNPLNERDIILNSIADGVFTVDKDWRITSFNRAAEKITGTSAVEAIGQLCCDVFRASICETACALRQTLHTGKPVINKIVYVLNADGDRITISISTALLKDADGSIIGGVETFRDLSLVEELRKEIKRSYSFADILSRNHRMKKLFDILPEVAVSGSTVLIEGESGTGKELLAKAVHSLSPRKKKPFVAVNCGALPDTLLESELFGYKAGAFTDAKKDKAGRFALARGGTIFLDEIGDVSPAMQIRLLRVLQEREYEPLGATVSEKADVRVIAATNQNLEALVKKGVFRKDLYYRINIVQLILPPLKERKEDIPLLAEHFISRFNRIQNKDISGLTDEALRYLMAHDYPGNIRELENIIERAFVLCGSGLIEAHHLPDSIIPAGTTISESKVSSTNLDEMEKHMITDALKRNGGNRVKAARELGIHKSTLYRKLEKYGIAPPK
jgi:PAS domain S-box-containing protein